MMLEQELRLDHKQVLGQDRKLVRHHRLLLVLHKLGLGQRHRQELGRHRQHHLHKLGLVLHKLGLVRRHRLLLVRHHRLLLVLHKLGLVRRRKLVQGLLHKLQLVRHRLVLHKLGLVRRRKLVQGLEVQHRNLIKLGRMHQRLHMLELRRIGKSLMLS